MTPDPALSLASMVMRVAWALMPSSERQWLEAMWAESCVVCRPSERLKWSLGCLTAAIRIRIDASSPAYIFASLLALALTTILDWTRCDPTVTILTLTSMTLGLGYLYPRRSWQVGWLCGLWLLAAHLTADVVVRARPVYQTQPLTAFEILQIAALLLIALPAALLGGRLAKAR
jgi:hypothetical protein